MSDETKTPRLDKIIYRLKAEHDLQKVHAELLTTVAAMDIAALETRYQENWNRNEQVIEERHAEAIRRLTVSHAAELQEVKEYQDLAAKNARREAYEEVAKMIEDDAESVELQHAGGHPDLQIILKATEITRDVAGCIREKAGKL